MLIVYCNCGRPSFQQSAPYDSRIISPELRKIFVNPFANKPWFLRVCSLSLLKTLWEKEKLLIMSNFSFSHSIFCPFGELTAIFINFKIVSCKLFQVGRVLNLSFGKGLNCLYLSKCWRSYYLIITQFGFLTSVKKEALENILGKRRKCW